MKDIVEQYEDAAERRYDELALPGGKMKCPNCRNPFNPDNEGGTISPNPWAMPVCGKCLGDYFEAMEEQADE